MDETKAPEKDDGISLTLLDVFSACGNDKLSKKW